MSSLASISNLPGINELPDDTLLEIFSHLDSTVLRIAVVCTRWKFLSDNERPYERIFDRELVFFGPKEWEEHFGLPLDIPKIRSYRQAVREAFTFASKWPKEWDKKMVWLQPKEILQEQLVKQSAQILITPRKIGELVAAKLKGDCDPKGYRFFWPAALQEHGDKSVEESCWVYMTPDVLLDSRAKSYEVQKKQAEDFGGEVPELALAATGILLKCLVTGKRLFSDNPWTYTRCKESTQGEQLVVGGFAPAGLCVTYDYFVDDSCGVAALRKFKGIGT